VTATADATSATASVFKTDRLIAHPPRPMAHLAITSGVSSGPHAYLPPRAGQKSGSHACVVWAYSAQIRGGGRKSMSQHTPEEQPLLGPTYRAVFLFCMFLVCAFNFADRAIFAVLAQSIRVDLKLTDFELSWIQVGFGVLYACMGVPFGRLAEH